MFPDGKVTMSDAEYVAIMEHDKKQAATITEQRARIAELEKERDYYRDLAQRRSR